MFKKNIAKLLVFAMILSMLPFSAVTAGAARTTREEDSNNGYVLIKDSKATVTGDKSTTLTLTAPNEDKGSGTKDEPYVLKNDSYVVAKDANNKKTVDVSFEIAGSAKVYYLGKDATASLSTENELTISGTTVNKAVDVEGQLSAEKDTEVTAIFATYSVSKDTTYYSLQFNVRAAAKVDVDVDDYTVTLDTNGGNISDTATWKKDATTGNYTYAVKPDTQVTLPTPTRDTYEFEGWYTDEAFTSTSKVSGDSVKVTASVTYYANWTEVTTQRDYKVNIDTGIEHGTVTSDLTYADENDTVTLTVEADPSYKLGTLHVYEVAKDTLNITNPNSPLTPDPKTGVNNAYTFTMPDSDVIIKAEFVPEETAHTVTVNSNIEGAVTITPNSDGTYSFAKDTVVTVNVNRVIGWDLQTIEVNGEALTKDEEVDGIYTFRMPNSNATVNATFEKRQIKNTLDVSYIAGDSANNWLNGALVLSDTIEGKTYVIEETIEDPIAGLVSVYISIEGDASGEITVPCGPDLTVKVTETDGVTRADLRGGKPVVGEFKTSTSGNSDALTRTDEEVSKLNEYYDQQTVRPWDTTSAPDVGEVTTYIDGEKAANWLNGALVLNGTTKGKTYIIEETIEDPIAGLVGAYISIVADGTGKIEIPCGKELMVKVTETDGVKKTDVRGVKPVTNEFETLSGGNTQEWTR